MNAHCRWSATALAAVLVCSPDARAQSVSEATLDSVLRSPASAASSPGGTTTTSSAAVRPLWSPRRFVDMKALRVIELPAEPLQLGGRGRKHHALSWRNDTLSNAMDDIGLSNAECHNRVRLPTRLKRTPGDGPAVQVQLQVAVGCSF